MHRASQSNQSQTPRSPVAPQQRLLLAILLLALVLPPARPLAAELPDLTIGADRIRPFLGFQNFSAGSCEVLEGCAIAGNRRYLRFDTETRNIGPGDLYLGSPIGNPLFHFQPCHGHFHFQGFAEYRLRNTAGVLAATSYKAGFCLTDGIRVLPEASAAPQYDCNNQGIQSGWADIYGAATTCQWIDITGLPAGLYTLEMEIDPDRLLAETDESNNITRMTVALDGPPCAGPPANNNFTNAQLISAAADLILSGNLCATKELNEPNHDGNAGGHSLWYRWMAPSNGPVVITTAGSTFDTLLAVYHGSVLNALTLDDSDDDSGGNRSSRVTFTATAGTEYRIAVDGYNGDTGGVLLTINPDRLTAPHFTAISPATGHPITLAGTIGHRYEIHATADLGAWSVLGRLTNLTGTVQFTDPAATNATQRFYRAVLVP